MPSTTDLLSGLNDEQREVVLYNDGPTLVLAGPGSGKTRALTHKIAYLISEVGIYPDHILAVTFTNKAAAGMKERVSDLLDKMSVPEVADYSTGGQAFKSKKPSWIGTFHSVCARILRTDGSKLDIGSNFTIYDTDDSTALIKASLNKFDLSTKDFAPNAVLGAISRAKCEMIVPADFESYSPKGYFYQVVAKIYADYQKQLKENNALDFNDLLSETVFLFNKHKDVLEKYQNIFEHILIDEYQDTNRVQYYLVSLLAKKNRHLTVVGDISQSIYSWRGADYRNMSQFEKDYPDAKVLHLAQNYRSTANILNAAKTLIQNNSSHIPIDLYTANGDGEKIVLYEAETERHEAKYISDTISFNAISTENYEYEPVYEYGNFAILYRTNAQSRAIEEGLLNNGIPYKIIGGLKFYDRKEIKDVLAYLRVFYNPNDTVSWMRCINTPPRKIGKKTLLKIHEGNFNIQTIEELTNLPWSKQIEQAKDPQAKPIDFLDEILKTYGYLEYLNDGTEESISRIENLKELRSVAKQFELLQQFLENVALIESSNKADLNNDSNAVIMMTLHAAKGLEFENVFIAGVEEGIMPHTRAMADPGELEEERRLAYVGITRAKKNLFLTYTRRRSFYGGSGSSLISRFVAEIPEELLSFKLGH